MFNNGLHKCNALVITCQGGSSGGSKFSCFAIGAMGGRGSDTAAGAKALLQHEQCAQLWLPSPLDLHKLYTFLKALS